jgi:hypothetical protein
VNVVYISSAAVFEFFEAVFAVYVILLIFTTGWFVWFSSFKSARLEEKVKKGNSLFNLAIFTTLLRIVSNEQYTKALEEMIMAEKLGIFDVSGAAKVSSKAVSEISSDVNVLFKLFSLKRSLNRNWRLLKRRAFYGLLISAFTLFLVLFGLLLALVVPSTNPLPYLIAGFVISLGGVSLYEFTLSYRSYARVRHIVSKVATEIYTMYVSPAIKDSSKKT